MSIVKKNQKIKIISEKIYSKIKNELESIEFLINDSINYCYEENFVKIIPSIKNLLNNLKNLKNSIACFQPFKEIQMKKSKLTNNLDHNLSIFILIELVYIHIFQLRNIIFGNFKSNLLNSNGTL